MRAFMRIQTFSPFGHSMTGVPLFALCIARHLRFEHFDGKLCWFVAHDEGDVWVMCDVCAA